MSRRIFACILTAALSLAGAGTSFLVSHVQAAPEPSLVPSSWELTFKHGTVQRIFVTVDGKRTAFYYMRYTVVNNTGRDILFTPDFQLLTDTGQQTTAFSGVPNEVFQKIKDLYKNPFMESPTQILGKLLQGDDNAKDGVIIFTGIDPEARNYQLYVSGLSGETAEVSNPVTHEPVVLQKTLVLEYDMPGSAAGIEPQPKLKATKWVMR